MSAIGYLHRVADWPDPSDSHFIRIALKGYTRMNPALDVRLPITLPILERVMGHSIISLHLSTVGNFLKL